MASSGKKKTTMAKLNRERKLHERRIDKAQRKDARKRASADGVPTWEQGLIDADGNPLEPAADSDETAEDGGVTGVAGVTPDEALR